MLYHFYEWNHAALSPLRAIADATKLFYENPLNPLSRTAAGRSMAAMAELFERTTRIYAKPEFGLYETVVNGLRVPVQDKVVWKKPFGQLLHFERELPKKHGRDPRILVVAPISGHYATLLRGTVDALLPYADVYITDWADARKVPLADGSFDLDDYVDYLVEMLQFLGPDTHVIGVCQPAVPVMMAVARMEEDEDDCAPATMTLMGGPIDTRINPTAVNRLAEEKGLEWFRDNVIMTVPFPHEGFMRPVYPGFLQLSGFMSMNLDRHMIAHKDFFWQLVKDDGDSAERHREFYDEYNAVMDLTAEFYLQTVDEVFIKHSLPKGELVHNGRRIDLAKIRRTALLTVEGENDDISGVGQTEAAQHLCVNIPDDKRVHYVQPKVGHYGVFNGSRFRSEICPRIVDFVLTHGTTHASAKLPRKAQPTPGAAGLQREGAVAEREAKADKLRANRSSAGETVLAGAVVPDAAGALKAVAAPAEALMKTAMKAAQPASALSENPTDDRFAQTESGSNAPARPAPAAKPTAASSPAPTSVPVRAEGKPSATRMAPVRAKVQAKRADKSAAATKIERAGPARPSAADTRLAGAGAEDGEKPAGSSTTGALESSPSPSPRAATEPAAAVANADRDAQAAATVAGPSVTSSVQKPVQPGAEATKSQPEPAGPDKPSTSGTAGGRTDAASADAASTDARKGTPSGPSSATASAASEDGGQRTKTGTARVINRRLRRAAKAGGGKPRKSRR